MHVKIVCMGPPAFAFAFHLQQKGFFRTAHYVYLTKSGALKAGVGGMGGQNPAMPSEATNEPRKAWSNRRIELARTRAHMLVSTYVHWRRYSIYRRSLWGDKHYCGEETRPDHLPWSASSCHASLFFLIKGELRWDGMWWSIALQQAGEME